MSLYLVDSNFFIQAHRATYPLDVAPSFWNKVKELVHDGKIISIDKVKNEIYNKEDDLKSWCTTCLVSNFFKESSSTLEHYTKLVQWAASRSSHYTPTAISEFMNAEEADAWLIAKALTDLNNIVLVTHEVSQPDRKNKIKIPDACIPHNVQYCNTIDMFRQLGETF